MPHAEHAEWLRKLLWCWEINHTRYSRKSNGHEVLLLEITMSALGEKLKAVFDDYDAQKQKVKDLTAANADLTAKLATAIVPDDVDTAQLTRLDTENAALTPPEPAPVAVEAPPQA